MLGETGSGKTVSGIMPLVRAMLSPHSGVGCALVIDPKRELLPAIRELDEQVRVIEPGGPGRPGSVLNLTATANWGLDADLEAGRFQEAATKILLRSAGLATRTPATVWAGLSPRAIPHQLLLGSRGRQPGGTGPVAHPGGDRPPPGDFCGH